MRMIHLLTILAPVTALAVGPLLAQESGGPADPVLVRVSAPRPWFAPWFYVRSRMQASVPEYQAIDGLRFKDYTFSEADDSFGGIYQYATRRQALARYDAAYLERGRQRYGADYNVYIYTILDSLDRNIQPEVTETEMKDQVVFAPAGADARSAKAWFSAEKAELSAQAGLRRAYLVMTEEGRVGIVLQWADVRQGESYLSDRWRQNFARDFGGAPQISEFRVPLALNNHSR